MLLNVTFSDWLKTNKYFYFPILYPHDLMFDKDLKNLCLNGVLTNYIFLRNSIYQKGDR